MYECLSILPTYIQSELLEEIRTAMELGDLCNQDHLDNLLMQKIMNLGELDTHEIITDIHNTVKEFLRNIIMEHGVKIDPEATIEESNRVLRTLLEIPTYMDIETINRIIESDVSNEEKLAELGQLVTDFTASRLVTVIHEVPKELIDLIYKTVGEVNSVERVAYPELVKTLASFVLFVKTKELLGNVLIFNDIVLGMPFERYIAYFAPSLDKWEPKQTAMEMLYILYMSRDGLKNPIEVFDKHAEELFHDFSIQNKVKLEMINFISLFTAFLASGENK